MALKNRWTPPSRGNYFKITQFILDNWTSKELQKFVDKTAKTLSQIAKGPELFPVSKKGNIRKCILSKQTILFYRIKKNEVDLVTFRDNRKNPKTLKL